MIKVVSYNVKLHEGYSELAALAETSHADIICLQEVVPAKVKREAGGLVLAETAQLGRVGLATYYNPEIFEHVESESHRLPLAWYERAKTERFRLLASVLKFNDSGEALTVGNIHLANLYASNHARRQQAYEAFSRMEGYQQNGSNRGAILTGDFNYPLFSKGLLNIAQQFGYHDGAGGDTYRTHTNPIIQSQFDRMFLSGLRPVSHEVLPFGGSDHAPIVTIIEP